MHGRIKVRTSEEEKVRKDNERAQKVKAYKSGMALLFKKRSSKEYSDEALEISSKLVSVNPDISTVWNYRREIILSMYRQNGEDINRTKLFDDELLLTEHCLKINPKSYNSWHQRIWVMDTRPDPDWARELKICNAYLKLDERNFHCWDYRRQIVTRSKTPEQEEFQYSTDKIHENFSNYSAWHYRSKLLTSLYPDEDKIRPIEEVRLKEELELVLNAAFTDPSDTSAWFYQRWLLGGSPEPISLAVCRVTATQSFISFNQSVPKPSLTYNLHVKVNDTIITGSWSSPSGLKNDILWILNHDNAVDSEIFCKANQFIEVHLTYGNSIEITFMHPSVKTAFQNEGNGVSNDVSNEYLGYSSVEYKNRFGDSVIKELEKQKESCEQLLELEPDSKWTNLTLAVIQHSIDHIKNHDSCCNILKKLITLDPKRKNYYKDLLSRWHIEYYLQSSLLEDEMVNNGKFSAEYDNKSIKISTLYHLQYWSASSEVDFSGHELTSNSLPAMYVLQNCQVLNLNDNCLHTLQGFPALPKLKTLYVKGNNICEEHIQFVKEKCPGIVDIVFK